ncbi:holo-ACP synthase [Lacticaseibacillus yichunensis]|uniref:Holo-[acyl-carrier-protein] synthase n=1 Tax=Lacticaseibacillus yichunensis TaxID=2486015 RepID=A0ABW4CSC6_9LACO|nr:holo-ACP synthase [Lacticaseibacillus yichunensis]
MIAGLGIDLTEIARIQEAQARNPHFAEKVLTPRELAIFEQLAPARAAEWLAGRFSVKESYSKAFGTGLGKVALHDVEVLDDASGKPIVTAHPFAGRALVSISHTQTLVMTEVILEASDK